MTFEDGSAARLRWSSWRYGLALCRVVIGMGDGPPGSFTLLPDDTGAGGQR